MKSSSTKPAQQNAVIVVTLRRLLFVAFVCLTPSVSHAETYDLKWDPALDGVITGLAVVSWFSAETFLKRHLAPKECRWCEPPGFDAYFRDQIVAREARASPNLVSDINLGVSAALAYGGLSVLATLEGDHKNIPVDALLLTESVAITMVLTNLAKWSFARRRPKGYHDRGPNLDTNLSFFSGHTSFTTSVGTTAGMIAALRGYQWAPQLMVAGVGLGVATAIARIATDAHYFSDVLVGFVVGTSVGIALPLIFHGREPSEQTIRQPARLNVPLMQFGGSF